MNEFQELVSLVPQHKDDQRALEALAYYLAEYDITDEFVALAPELLAWTLDPNWPIAVPLGHLLAFAGLSLVPPLKEALMKADGAGQYGLIVAVVLALPIEAKAALVPTLEAIVATNLDECAVEEALGVLASLQA